MIELIVSNLTYMVAELISGLLFAALIVLAFYLFIWVVCEIEKRM
jgi:ABC-type multidrug transport system permease subunit